MVSISKREAGWLVAAAQPRRTRQPGAFDQLVVRTDSGTTFSVVVANESAIMESLHEGDRVWCGLHFDDLVLMPDV